MYIPKHFKSSEEHDLRHWLCKHPFGQLISLYDGRLLSTHLPVRIDEEQESLSMHLARGNPQWRDIEGQEVLLSFVGPHGYVSPTWYENPGVPTWNYEAVHIYGQCTLIHDPKLLQLSIEALGSQFEPGGYSLEGIPFAQAKLGAVVGVEMRISSVEEKYKLGQNRSEGDRARVIEALRHRGESDLANAIEATLNQTP